MSDLRELGGLLGFDLTRPKVANPDGSYSTESTITVGSDGRYYNIPTIINGARVSTDMAIRAWRAGNNPHVGETFITQDDATRAAKERTRMIGSLRGLLGY